MADAWPSADLVREQAYLVSRGVRALALLGSCALAEAEEARGLLLVQGQHYPEAMPFVVAGGGRADFGFAAAAWAVELFAWSQSAPERQRERIEGLLLGYGPREIARHEEARGVGPGEGGAFCSCRGGLVTTGCPRRHVGSRRGGDAPCGRPMRPAKWTSIRNEDKARPAARKGGA